MEEKNTLLQLKNQERDARKRLILDSAIELFSTRPISDVGMRDIAKNAGISPSLIYRHFKNQDELFITAFNEKTADMIESFKQSINEKDGLSTEKIGTEFVNYMYKNDSFFRMMTHYMLETPMHESEIGEFDKTVRSLLEIFDVPFLQNGTKEEARLHSHAFFAALNGILITYRHYPGRSKNEIYQHILKLTKLIGQKFSN